MVKIQKLPNGQLIITIPKRLAEFKGWDKGTDMIFRDHTKDSIILALNEQEKEEEKEDDESNE